jgi:hypothetical protein
MSRAATLSNYEIRAEGWRVLTERLGVSGALGVLPLPSSGPYLVSAKARGLLTAPAVALCQGGPTGMMCDTIQATAKCELQGTTPIDSSETAVAVSSQRVPGNVEFDFDLAGTANGGDVAELICSFSAVDLNTGVPSTSNAGVKFTNLYIVAVPVAPAP